MMECPSHSTLEAVARGEADDRTARHVAECATCASEMESLKEDMALFDRLQSADLGETAHEADDAIEIAGYTLEQELHRGAQGVVYRAMQTAAKRAVAVKALLGGAYASPRQKRRFEREIEVVASLRHPAIVTVHDSGVTGRGTPFLVMELIDGVPLDEYVRRRREQNRWTVRAAIELAERIAGAVAYAHQHAVLHRDLKPSNILVDAEGSPHIVDFGLARRMDLDPRVTLEGAFVGTLAYASPEQAGAGDVDARSDVYALGAILHEMLTGDVPTSMEGSLPEVIARIQTAEPRSIRGAAAVGRIDDETDTIVRRALARDPDERYQTAEALRQDLDRAVRGEPIDAKRDSTVYVLRKTLARHRVPVVVAAMFILLLAGFGVAMLILYQEARLEADRANTIRIFLEDTLGSVEPSGSGDPVTMRETLDEAVHWVGLALADRPRVEGSVRTTIGNSYRALGELDAAEAQLTNAIDIFEGRRRDRAELARAVSALALLRLDQNRAPEALELLERAWDLRAAALGRRHPSLVYTKTNIARALRDLGRMEEAEAELRHAIALATRIHAGDHPDVALCTYRLAELLEPGDESVTLYERALSIQQAALPADHPDIERTRRALEHAKARE